MIVRRCDYSPEVDAVLDAVLSAADGVDLALLALALLDQHGVSADRLAEVAHDVDRSIEPCHRCGRTDRAWCEACRDTGLFEGVRRAS